MLPLPLSCVQNNFHQLLSPVVSPKPDSQQVSAMTFACFVDMIHHLGILPQLADAVVLLCCPAGLNKL